VVVVSSGIGWSVLVTRTRQGRYSSVYAVS
jgi:hypothetical protein